MHRHSPLTLDQIQELRNELTKILQENMIPFEEKIASSSLLTQSYDLDSNETSMKSKIKLENEQNTRKHWSVHMQIKDNVVLVMSNFELIWQQVYHRESKILQLRETFSSANNYIEELKCENEQMKNRLSQAETYIDWIQEQKQYLDAIYDTSRSMIDMQKSGMNRCVSQSNLRWSKNQRKKSVNYQKLKEYIQTIKEERNEMQKELFNLTKRCQIKRQQNRKLSLIVEHLVQKLKKYQKKGLRDVKVCYDHISTQNQICQDQMMMRNIDNYHSATSLEQNLLHTSFLHQKSQISQYYEPKQLRNDFAFKSLNRIHSNYSGLSSQKDTKDVQICTESQIINHQTVQTQTQNKQNKAKNDDKQYKISISISGVDKQKDQNINKIISQLKIQQQLKGKLNKEKNDQKSKIIKNDKKVSNKIPSMFQYYRQRLVSNRIKKYYFQKPVNQTGTNFYKNT